MNNIEKDFELIKNAEESALRKLSMELATKEGAKSYNKNSQIALGIAFILSSLAINGEMKNIRRETIEEGANVNRTDANNAVKKLVEKDLVKKYRKVNKVNDVRNKEPKFRYDKYEYTLIATNKLVDMITEAGYSISFDRNIIDDLILKAIEETSKVVKTVKKDKNGVQTTETVTTNARGERTKTTEVDMKSVQQAMEIAKEDYENRIAEIEEQAARNGKEEELAPVQPLVSANDIIRLDQAEFEQEQREMAKDEDFIDDQIETEAGLEINEDETCLESSNVQDEEIENFEEEEESIVLPGEEDETASDENHEVKVPSVEDTPKKRNNLKKSFGETITYDYLNDMDEEEEVNSGKRNKNYNQAPLYDEADDYVEEGSFPEMSLEEMFSGEEMDMDEEELEIDCE